jgi:hypothetical protein
MPGSRFIHTADDHFYLAWVAKLIKEKNYTKLATLFSDHSFDVNSPGGDDKTPLVEAIKANNSDLVELFLLMGANPLSGEHKASAGFGWYREEAGPLTALYQHEKRKAILAIPNHKQLHSSWLEGRDMDPKIVKLLRPYSPYVDTEKNQVDRNAFDTPFNSTGTKAEQKQSLVDNQARGAGFGFRQKQHTLTVRCLFAYQNKEDTEAFIQAIKNNDVAAMQGILDKGYSYDDNIICYGIGPSSHGTTCTGLALAAHANAFEAADFLIKQGAILTDPSIRHEAHGSILERIYLERDKQGAMAKAFAKADGKMDDCRDEIKQIQADVDIKLRGFKVKYKKNAAEQEQQTTALLTETTQNYKPLLEKIYKLEAHGERMFYDNRKQARATMKLAQDLREQVLSVMDNPDNVKAASEQIDTLIQDNQPLLEEDRKIRDYVGPILLAMTGVGLFVLAALKYHTGTGFFNKTNRQNLLDDVKTEHTTQHKHKP